MIRGSLRLRGGRRSRAVSKRIEVGPPQGLAGFRCGSLIEKVPEGLGSPAYRKVHSTWATGLPS
jgi:hypothetical protein